MEVRDIGTCGGSELPSEPMDDPAVELIEVVAVVMRHPAEGVEQVEEDVDGEVTSPPGHVAASDPAAAVEAVEGAFGAARSVFGGRC